LSFESPRAIAYRLANSLSCKSGTKAEFIEPHVCLKPSSHRF
jgi:hypothetical protein